MNTRSSSTFSLIVVLAVITALGPMAMQIILPVLPVMQVAIPDPGDRPKTINSKDQTCLTS